MKNKEERELKIIEKKFGGKIKKTTKKEAKWLSDLETLKKHYSKFARDKEGYLIYDTKENAEKYMRVDYENSCKYIDEENKKIKEEQKEGNEKKLNSFLQEDRQKFVSLGCGFHRGIYYFGTKLFRDGEPYTAIITSNKKVYLKLGKESNEIRNGFGLNYKDDFYDEGLDNLFSREAIDKWINGSTRNITLKNVYEKLINIFKKYIYFEDKRNYSLLACYRIASFFMPVWRARARLFIWAEMGSAKSRLTQILHNTGFNSVSLGDWTLAYLQRLIESTRGETHIDDFETLDEEKKNSTIRLVKVGFMKGFKAGKISEGKIRRPETYDLFNTTTLNNTSGLDFVSADRCITIRIPKIAKKEYDKEPDFEDKIWKELRDELYILGLKYPKQAKETYNKISSEKIRGRLFFIIKPELTIAKLISNKIYEELEAFWIEEIEQRENIDYETNWEFLAFKKIYKLLFSDKQKLLSPLSPNSPHTTLPPLSPYFNLTEDIVKPIGLELYGEEEFKKKKRGMSIIIGSCLTRSPVFKKRISRGRKQYNLKNQEFLDLLKAKKFLELIEEVEGEIGDSGDNGGGKMGIATQENKGNLETQQKIQKIEEMIKKLKKEKYDPKFIKTYEKELGKLKNIKREV